MTRSDAIETVLTELQRAEAAYPPFTSVSDVLVALLKQIADVQAQLLAGEAGDLTHDLPQIAVVAIRGLMAQPVKE